jgi:hypothetical protein
MKRPDWEVAAERQVLSLFIQNESAFVGSNSPEDYIRAGFRAGLRAFRKRRASIESKRHRRRSR